MTREALVAPLLLAWRRSGGGAAGQCCSRWRRWRLLAFVYCQARILQAATGIPAWREPLIVPLIVATGLAEGAGLWMLLALAIDPRAGVWAGLRLALTRVNGPACAGAAAARRAPGGAGAVDGIAPATSSTAARCCRWRCCWSCWPPLPPAVALLLQALAGPWRWPVASGSSSR
jgi:hypothetical protein